MKKRSPTVLTRREQLKLALAAGSSLLVPGCDVASDGARKEKLAIVVGSGFGGAVAALRLGEAGIRTVVLERGRRWTIDDAHDAFSTNFPADKRSTWLRTETVLPVGPVLRIEPYVGVLERVDTPTVKVFAGAGVGGGSLVYGGMTVQPVKALFEKVFPPGLPYDELDEIYYPRVRRMLGTARIPADLMARDEYLSGRVAREHAEKAGLSTLLVEQATDWSVVKREIDGELSPSALSGELIYGANSGWKNSLDRNYLPAAEATGKVTIRPLHQVRDIARDAEGGYVLAVDEIDEYGEVVNSSSMRCDYLFLAAGSMVTPRMLLRAKAAGALPDLDPSVGKGWGTNGAAMFMRSGLTGSTGTTQAVPPYIAIVDHDNPVAPVLAEVAEYPTGFECHCLLQLGLALDETRGEFVLDDATGDAFLEWPAGGNDRAAKAMASLVERLDAANGGELETTIVPGVTKDFTYHPLGGCVLGQACDLFGRVKGYAHLYVMDGSLLPGSSACANPSLTIAAIAERNIENILREDLA